MLDPKCSEDLGPLRRAASVSSALCPELGNWHDAAIEEWYEENLGKLGRAAGREG